MIAELLERPNILICEDQPEVAEELAICVAKDGSFATQIIDDLRNVDATLSRIDYDAASIDWEWFEKIRGPQLLRKLRDKDPEAGILVFTQHEVARGQALEGGADYVVIKRRDGGLREFKLKIEQAARLGLGRKIWKALPSQYARRELRITRELTGEADLRSAAVWAGMELRATGREDHNLTALLKRGGWWHATLFDAAEYVGLPREKKLHLLAESAGITAAEIGEMIESRFLEDLKTGDAASHENMDRLLSILAYMLRLSGYDLSIMPYYANIADHFVRSGDPPPWDNAGLHTFLLSEKCSGIRRAFSWIREH